MRFVFVCFALFAPLVASLDVTCQFRNFDIWSIFAGTYDCHITGIDYRSPNEVVTGVFGQHLPDKSFSDVKTITIDESVCQYLPQGFENYFKNIEGLTIRASQLQQITQDDLKAFPKLKSLFLVGNKLTSLDANLFQFNPRLKSVFLGSNQISYIAPTTFDSLKNLDLLYMVENVCIDSKGLIRETVKNVIREIKEKCH